MTFLKSDASAPKTITTHPGVAFCVDGSTHDVEGKWLVWLKPQWKFSAGHAQECTSASFDTVSEFKLAAPVEYQGRLAR